MHCRGPGQEIAALLSSRIGPAATDITSTFEELVEQIAARVRPFCTKMPDAEFRRLVEEMARIEEKYLQYPHGASDELKDPEE